MPDLRAEASTRAGAELRTTARIAPELISGLKVLSLPASDLVPFAAEAAERNPLLEVDYESELFRFGPIPGEGAFADAVDAFEDDRVENPWRYSRSKQAQGSIASVYEWDFSRIQDDCMETETLHEHLRLQVGGLGLAPRDVGLMDALIECVGEDGYFEGRVTQVAFENGADVARVEGLLGMLQTLHPAGVAAVTLSDCLLAQISPAEPMYDALCELVRDHLDDLAANRMTRISRALGVTMEEIAQMRAVVLSLNPRPGQDFYVRPSPFRYVIPDIVVRREGSRFEAHVTGSDQPCLALNEEYLRLMDDGGIGDDARDYLKQRFDEAMALMKSLDARRSTLRQLALYLVRRQYRYFLTEGRQLEPMTMQQVADDLGVHVSTVSRTVQGKYLQVPWGSVPLKSLFTRGMDKTEGAADQGPISSFEVKRMIQAIIDREPAESPLSDTAICDQLNARGVSIKRRTVAKYRASMGLGTQSARKWAARAKMEIG